MEAQAGKIYSFDAPLCAWFSLRFGPLRGSQATAVHLQVREPIERLIKGGPRDLENPPPLSPLFDVDVKKSYVLHNGHDGQMYTPYAIGVTSGR